MRHPELFTDIDDSNVIVRLGVNKSSLCLEDTKNLSSKTFEEIEAIYNKYDKKVFVGQWAKAYLPIVEEYYKRLDQQLPGKFADFLKTARTISKQDLIELISTYIPLKHQEAIFKRLKGESFFFAGYDPKDFIAYHAGFLVGTSRARWAFTPGSLLGHKLVCIRLYDKAIKKYTTEIWVISKEN